MIVPSLGAYKDFEWAFPKRDINPKDKQADYCRRNAEAIYSLFCRNKLSWGQDTWNHFSVLRAYSRGEQDTSQYKSWLTNDISDSNNTSIATDSFDSLPLSRIAKRQGWYNVMFKNISPAPQIMNALHGQFDKLDFDLYCNVIDPDSRALEEERAYMKLVEAQNADWQNKLKMDMGIPIDEEIVLPKSKEELDMMKAKDGFKLNVARAMQKIIRHSFNISRWDNVVLKKVIDDLISLGYGVTEDYFDTEDSKFKCGYTDPDSFVAQYSKESDYSDMEYCGKFYYVTISNLRNKCPEVKEEKWKELAGTCVGMYGNPKFDWTTYSKLDPNTPALNYDGFKVPVLRACWIDTNIKRKLHYNSKYGRKSIIDLGYDSEVKPLTADQVKSGATQEIKPVFIRQPYECYWVVGQDYVYDFGPIKMAAREALNKPQLPFHVEQLLQPSIIDRLVPILDQIVLTFLRYQNSLAMMFERGYAVNVGMLANINLGGGKMKVGEVIKLAKQTGFWLYQYSPGTGLYTGGAATPVTPVDGGMGKRVEETIATLEMWMKQIENMTGISPVALSGTPDPTLPASTTSSVLQATANILKPITDAFLEIKQDTGECMMRRIQVGIRNSEKIRKAYAGVISPSDMDALKLMESEGVQYGLSLKAKPDKGLRAKIDIWIEKALQNVREQRPGIEIPDAIFFSSQLDRGADINDIEDQLRYIINKYKEEADAQAEKNMRIQGEVNAQNEQVKQQGIIEQTKADAEAKMAEEALRGDIKDSLLTKENNIKFLQLLMAGADAEDGLTTNKSE